VREDSAVTTSTAVSDPCPHCAVPTVSARGAQPWCPSCEWNLSRFEPDRARVEFGWTLLDRRLHRVAYRLSAGQFAALSGGPLARRSATPARVVTLTAAVLLVAGVLALAAFGVWLVSYDFPSVTTVLGVLMLALAFALRPRLGRLSEISDEMEILDRGQAPALFALVDRVCAAIRAPPPHIVGLAPGFNAFTTTVGLRRRRVLCVGAPLWATLDPQERVALLGHELGHFVNGDLRRGPLSQAAETTLGKLAYLLSPSEDGRSAGMIAMVAALVVNAVMWVLSRLIFGAHLLLVGVSQRDSQRAEYLADELAARTGGTAAAVRLFDQMLIAGSIDTVVRREARARNGARAWRAAAVVARRNLADALPSLRQLSRRDEVSLFASHPPTGLRAAMLESRPAQPAAIELAESDSARIDEELADHYEGVRGELAYSS
jgi:heat shock protein HtpX